MGPRSSRAGFTLAEVGVTIVIVGIMLVVSAQALMNSQAQAAHTRNIKIARELGMLTLGRLEAGLLIDEIQDHMEGDYADDEQPDFTFEVVLGTEEFNEEDATESDRYDSWETDDDEDEDSESSEPWVVARVKVRFPAQTDRKDHVVIERWLTREFVYGPEEEDE